MKKGGKVPLAVTGVFLFAMAYFVGAAVGRVSGDLFDDGDLSWLPTENKIRSDVYCHFNGRGTRPRESRS